MRRGSAVALLVVALAGAACSKRADNAALSADPDEPRAAEDATGVALRDDSASFLLVWIDEKGDFHTEVKVADVPLAGRDAVRVIDPEREEGSSNKDGKRVFVADLRTKSADGTYPVKTLPKSQFDELAVLRRAKGGATLANAAPPPNGSAPTPGTEAARPRPQANDTDPNAAARPAVIIYGAEWCGPCHQAKAWLNGKGIPFVEKDVDHDPGAIKEMQAKLARVGKHGGSIPVLDVRGKIMIGFSPGAVEEALGKAL